MAEERAGDPLFYDITEDELALYEAKNADYRSKSDPNANFNRIAAWMALYPDMNWAQPDLVAVLLGMKQMDAFMSLKEKGVEGGVENLDTRARDVHIYWKIVRVIEQRRKQNTAHTEDSTPLETQPSA